LCNKINVADFKNAITEAELRQVAESLIQRLFAEAAFLNDINYKIVEVKPNYQRIKNSLDFGIPYEPKIVEINVCIIFLKKLQ
jgi:hypothetical protein